MAFLLKKETQSPSTSVWWLSLLLWSCHWHGSQGLASPSPESSSSRRDLLWKAPFGAVVTYAYGRAFYNTLSNTGLRHPPTHERRVRSTVSRTLVEAVASWPRHPTNGGGNHRHHHHHHRRPHVLRVLEVGIGPDCRVIRRDLYGEGLQQALALGNGTIEKVQVVGVDIKVPKADTLQSARGVLQEATGAVPVDLDVLQQSITGPALPFDDGSFDAIVCCLTLCSVDRPDKAVREMNRLLRPAGGTLGYVEHVAVNPDEPYAFLERQQVWLDPWQRRLAENCHLHRYTQGTVRQNLAPARLVQQERFLVDDMWPVSMQACGVLQKVA